MGTDWIRQYPFAVAAGDAHAGGGGRALGGDGGGALATEHPTGDGGGRLPVFGGVEVGDAALDDDVDAFHALTVGEGDPAVGPGRVAPGRLFACWRLSLVDEVELLERGDVVRAQGKRLRKALVAVGAADDVDGMHDGPVQCLVVRGSRVPGEDVVVGLRPAQTEDATEGAHELVLQLKLLFGSGAGASAVQDDQSVLDLRAGGDGIDALGDAGLEATAGITGAAAEEQVGDGTVGVVEDGDLLGGVVGALHVAGEDQAVGSGVDVGAADVLGEGSALGEDERGCGDIPDGGCLGDQGIGLGVSDAGAEISGIGEVGRVVGVPVDGRPPATEVRWSGDPARSAGGG